MAKVGFFTVAVIRFHHQTELTFNETGVESNERMMKNNDGLEEKDAIKRANPVAQSDTLLYRRMTFGKTSPLSGRTPCRTLIRS
jgi:hypothetical protein